MYYVRENTYIIVFNFFSGKIVYIVIYPEGWGGGEGKGERGTLSNHCHFS